MGHYSRKDDWAINVAVRAELVKRWIDIMTVDISTVCGVVYLKGTLSFRTDKHIAEEQIPLVLKQLEKKLRGIKGVRDVKMDFVNWIKIGETWKALKEQEIRARSGGYIL